MAVDAIERRIVQISDRGRQLFHARTFNIVVADGVRRSQLFNVGGLGIRVGGGGQLQNVRSMGVAFRAERFESGADLFADEFNRIIDQSIVHVLIR